MRTPALPLPPAPAPPPEPAPPCALPARLLLVLLPLQAAAEYQRLEAIVAVVDDDVVLASELMTRLETVRRSIAENDLQPPPGDVLINQIMERLIIENIQLQEAEKRGVTVDDESLARAVGSFASSNNMTRLEASKDWIKLSLFMNLRAEVPPSRLFYVLTRCPVEHVPVSYSSFYSGVLTKS